MNRIGIVGAALSAGMLWACATQPAPAPTTNISVSQGLMESTPPPVVSTPVPVVHAHSVPGAGRPDPFVALYGPPEAAGPAKPKSVSVSTFPNIPALPGFGSGGNPAKSIWDGISLT